MITLCFGLGLLTANAIQISVDGDITFDLQIDDGKRETLVVHTGAGEGEMKAHSDRSRYSGASEELRERRREKKRKRKKRAKRHRYHGVTAAEALECVYQYPETSQVEALLSNMMNQLAKVYVRVQEYVSGVSRRGAGAARFHVVGSKNSTFFDEIYANMTHEFRNMYNSSSWHVPRTNDPCDVQPELKSIWSGLLDASIQGLKEAARNSVGRVLVDRPVSAHARSVLQRMVDKQLARVRAAQLHTLCDDFQLCFNDLLHNQTDTATEL